MLSGRLAGPVPVYLLLLHWPAVDRSIVGIQWKPVGRTVSRAATTNENTIKYLFYKEEEKLGEDDWSHIPSEHQRQLLLK